MIFLSNSPQYRYNGPIPQNKVSNEQRQAALASANFTNTLRSLFQQQFNTQQATLKTLQDNFQKYVTNPQGFSDTALTGMRTQASDTLAQQFNAAKQQFQNRAFILGGRQLPSGALLGGENALDIAHAGAESQTQQAITMANEQQKLANMFQSASILGNVAGLQSPNGLMQGAIQNGQISDKEIAAAFPASSWLGNLLGGVAGGLVGLIPGVGPMLAPLASGAVSGLAGGSGSSSPFNFGGLFGGGGSSGPVYDSSGCSQGICP